MTNVRAYTDKQILDRCKSLLSFKEIPKGIWLCGIRSNENTPNIYDDKMYQFDGEKFLQVTSCTTEPGASGLIDFKKYQHDGIAVVKANEWYYDLWAYGLHKGKMPALKQVNNIKFYRDADGDKFAEEIGKVYEGVIGINWHTATYIEDPKTIETLVIPTVGTWSLGCQVHNVVKEYKSMLSRMKTGKISYCLLDEFEV